MARTYLPTHPTLPSRIIIVAALVSLFMSATASRISAAIHPPAITAGILSIHSGVNRPNIVMLMTDDQTVQDMQVMHKVQRLIGAEGVSFANSFVSYPMCCPSRATYLTGQYAHNHGVLYNHGPHGGYAAFKHPETSFPAALQRAGYDTIHIGKLLNGFGSHTLQAPPGWTDFRGALDPTTYNYYNFALDENGKLHTYPGSERNYRTDVYARMASAIIRREAHSGRPFFLNVAFLAPHSSGPQEEALGMRTAWIGHGMMDHRLAVPPRRYRGVLDELPLPRPASFDERDMSDKPRFMQHGSFFRRFTRTDLLDITRRYHARLESLLAVDDAAEQVIRTLQETGTLKNTVVVFTSDNGFFDGEHRIRAGKYFAYEPSVRVPLLIRGPGIPRGVTHTEMVGNIDLAPTILALAHAQPLRVMDGRPLTPLLQTSDAGIRWQRDLLLESGPNSDYPAIYHAIRTDRYLYVEYNTGDRELYDLKTDPDEMTNLVGVPAAAGIKLDLRRRLRLLEACAGASCQRAQSGQL